MNMKFINFVLTKVTFILNRDFRPIEGEMIIAPEIAANHELRLDDKQLIVMLGIRKLSGNIPYYFEVEAAGLFQFDEIPEEKILRQFSAINCPAILFPYIRETVADLTRRAGFPPLHINPVNFIQLAKEMEIQKQSN